MGRKRAFSWLGMAGGACLWWQARHWAPPREEFPMQGVLIGAADGEADFKALRAIGADFAYLQASEGASGRDPAFAANLERVRASELPFGVVHIYDP